MLARDSSHIPFGPVQVVLDALARRDVAGTYPDLTAGIGGGAPEQARGLEYGRGPAVQCGAEGCRDAGEPAADHHHPVVGWVIRPGHPAYSSSVRWNRAHANGPPAHQRSKRGRTATDTGSSRNPLGERT